MSWKLGPGALVDRRIWQPSNAPHPPEHFQMVTQWGNEKTMDGTADAIIHYYGLFEDAIRVEEKENKWFRVAIDLTTWQWIANEIVTLLQNPDIQYGPDELEEAKNWVKVVNPSVPKHIQYTSALLSLEKANALYDSLKHKYPAFLFAVQLKKDVDPKTDRSAHRVIVDLTIWSELVKQLRARVKDWETSDNNPNLAAYLDQLEKEKKEEDEEALQERKLEAALEPYRSILRSPYRSKKEPVARSRIYYPRIAKSRASYTRLYKTRLF